MFAYLALALLLLLVSAWFVLAPFLAPAGAPTAARTVGRPPVVTPPKKLAPTAPTATAALAATTATATTASSPSVEDVRASVEAAIAARKAAMMRHSCSGCGTPVDAGDAFCRACGTRVEEG